MQKTMIIGNLGNDPQLRTMPSGKQVASFSVCANTRYRNRQGETVKEAVWYKANVYGNSAKIVAERLHKGSRVYVEGRIKPELWEGQDGEKRFTLNLEARDVQFLDAKNGAEGPAAASEETSVTGGGNDLTDDDVPF